MYSALPFRMASAISRSRLLSRSMVTTMGGVSVGIFSGRAQPSAVKRCRSSASKAASAARP